MGKGFDIDFELLPPKLQVQLWILALDANTSKVNIAYRKGAFRTSTAYNFGGNVEASLGYRRLSTTFGVNPSNADLSLGFVFRGFKFGTSANFTTNSYDFNLGFGTALLPFPAELSKTFNSANDGIMSITKDIQMAPNNPLVWYKMHSDDASVITKAISTGQQIAKQKEKSERFGVGIRLKYSPETQLVITGGAQFRF